MSKPDARVARKIFLRLHEKKERRGTIESDKGNTLLWVTPDDVLILSHYPSEVIH